MWGLGTAAARSPAPWIRDEALATFTLGAARRSPHPRAMAFAGLGAAEILRCHPGDAAAAALLGDAATAVGAPGETPQWPWPQPDLTYANAALAEVVIAAGHLREDGPMLAAGLRMLTWLRDIQITDGRLSVVPASGWQRHGPRARHDQQPIEVAALADACATAAAVTGEPCWDAGVRLAGAWFLGDNDVGTPMWDPATGGGYDGLTPHGPNLNQGAESTLALISTLQHAAEPVMTSAGPGYPAGPDAGPRPAPRHRQAVRARRGRRARPYPRRGHHRPHRAAGRGRDRPPARPDAEALRRPATTTSKRPSGTTTTSSATASPESIDLSPTARALVGAYFSHEYAVEAAALCNPSMVAHPDQSALGPAQLRVVISLRQIGEGHMSSIGFATAVIGPGTSLTIADRSGPLQAGRRRSARHRRDLLAAGLADDGWDNEVSATVLGSTARTLRRRQTSSGRWAASRPTCSPAPPRTAPWSSCAV